MQMGTRHKMAAVLPAIVCVLLISLEASRAAEVNNPGVINTERSHHVAKRSLLKVISTANISDIPNVVAQAPLNMIIPTMAQLNQSMRMTVMMALPGSQILLISQKLPQEQRGQLLGLLPAEGVVSLAHLLTQDELGELLSLLSADSINNLTHSLSQDQLGDLLKSLSSGSIVNLTNTLTKDQNMEIIRKITPASLLNLLKSLNEEQSVHVLDRLPPAGVANLTASLSDADLMQLLASLPARAVGKLVLSFPQDAVQVLLKRIPYSSIRNLTESLTAEDLAQLAAILPPDTVHNLTSLLPTGTVTDILALLPGENLESLLPEFTSPELEKIVFALSPEQVSKVLSKLPAKGLSFLLNTLPVPVVLNVTLDLPDDVLGTVLTVLPIDDVIKLINTFPLEAVNLLVPKVPVPLLLNLAKKLPVEFLLSLSVQSLVSTVLNIPRSELFTVINELIPGGLSSLTSMLSSILDDSFLQSISPEDIQTFLKAIPQDLVTNLLHSLLPKILQTAGKDQDFQTLIGQLLTPDLVKSLGDLLKEPSVTNSIFHSLGALLKAVPLTDLLGMGGKLIPQIPILLAEVLGDAASNMSLSAATSGMHQCVLDLQLFLRDLSEGRDWAIQMFDAFGKPGRSLLKGNTHMLGSLEQCLDIRHVAQNGSSISRLIKGNYCGAQIIAPPGLLPPTPGKGILPEVTLSFYGCLPDSCHDTDINQFLSTVSFPLNISIPDFWCSQEPTLSTSDTSAVVAICILVVIAILVVAGTVVDVVCGIREDNDNTRHFSENLNMAFEMNDITCADTTATTSKKEVETSLSNGGPISSMPTEDDSVGDCEKEGFFVKRVLLAFSLPRNAGAILSTDSRDDDVMCLHGLRALSICWVIVGHTFYFMALFFENGLTAAEALQTVLGQVVINSTLAVDTFFVLSGCLTAYLSLLTVRQDEGVSAKRVGQFYLHRYLRITPTYGIIIMFCTCLLPYFSGGPDWWRKSTEYYSSCRSYWWTNILYINNFYRSHDDQCLPWSWYLSADMQLYWLAPILLLILAAGFRIVGGLITCGVVVMHCALTAYLEQSVNGDFLRNADDFSWHVFQKTYCRCAPYVLGLGVGYILTRVKGFYTMSKAARIIGWICTLALTSTTTFIKYDENNVMLDQPFYWSEQSRAVHEALFRVGFSLAVCWIIFACATGNGGFFNSILSWRGFLPLSRLSFCVYLLHPMIMLADMWTARIPVYFTISYVFQRSFGYLFMSLVFSFVVSAAVEKPVSSIERLFYRRRTVREQPF